MTGDLTHTERQYIEERCSLGIVEQLQLTEEIKNRTTIHGAAGSLNDGTLTRLNRIQLNLINHRIRGYQAVISYLPYPNAAGNILDTLREFELIP